MVRAMIFSMADHVEQIKSGTKTQTRRRSNYYLVGKSYSVQPGRRKAGILEGRIRIIRKIVETRVFDHISPEDAQAEGGYTPMDFENLYARMYPDWQERYAYKFRFEPRKKMKIMKMRSDPGKPRKGG